MRSVSFEKHARALWQLVSEEYKAKTILKSPNDPTCCKGFIHNMMMMFGNFTVCFQMKVILRVPNQLLHQSLIFGGVKKKQPSKSLYSHIIPTLWKEHFSFTLMLLSHTQCMLWKSSYMIATCPANTRNFSLRSSSVQRKRQGQTVVHALLHYSLKQKIYVLLLEINSTSILQPVSSLLIPVRW